LPARLRLLGFFVPQLRAPLPGGRQAREWVESDVFSLPKRRPHQRPLVEFLDPFEHMDELEFNVFIFGALHFEHLEHLQQEHGRNTRL
jgi:hypothetical protein